ncbi:hypothetical protein GN956_G1577 [Arapaima gigas]
MFKALTGRSNYRHRRRLQAPRAPERDGENIGSCQYCATPNSSCLQKATGRKKEIPGFITGCGVCSTAYRGNVVKPREPHSPLLPCNQPTNLFHKMMLQTFGFVNNMDFSLTFQPKYDTQ